MFFEKSSLTLQKLEGFSNVLSPLHFKVMERGAICKF
jgi:hypothetical protein